MGVLIASLSVVILSSQREAHRELERRFDDRAHSIAGTVDGLLSSLARQTSIELSAAYGDAGPRSHQLEDRRRRTVALYTAVAELDGRVIAATNGTPRSAATRASRAADRLRTDRGLGYVVTGIVTESGRPVIEFAVPFPSGHAWRILITGVPVGAWSAFLDATLARTPPAGARALIVDAGGRLLGDSQGAVGAGTSSGLEILHRAGLKDPILVRAKVGKTPLNLMLAVPRERLYHPVSGGRGWLPWILLALAALAMLGGLYLLARLARSHAALQRNEERFSLAVRGANDGIWDWDLQSDRIHFSDRWAEILDTTSAALGDSPGAWFERVHPEDLAGLDAAISSHLERDGGDPLEHEFRMRREGDGWVWVLVRGIALFDADGSPYRLAGSLTDVTERRRAVERLEHQANHDPLTGLANRAYFHRLLERELERSSRDGSPPCAVLFFDLNGFKAINDNHGHLTGDRLLRTIARRLQDSVRPGDVVGRLGGDEIAVLLHRVEEEGEAVAAAARLGDVISMPFPYEDGLMSVGASAGVAVSRPGDSADDVLREADAAMYREKLRA